MPTPFAALEQSVNGVVVDNLSNKTLIIDSVSVDGIFDDTYIEAGFVESSNPMFTAKSDDMPSVAQGHKAVDGAKQYEIVSVQPDGTGMTTIELRLEWLT